MKKTRIQKYYNNVIIEDLLLECDCKNMMQLPQIDQIVLNKSSKAFRTDKHEIIKAFLFLELLSGQKGLTAHAHKSIAAFQLRRGSHIGCFVTLRGSRMYAMLDKILTLLFPRLQNYSTFDDLSPIKLSCAAWGKTQVRNLTLGLSEATQFPEVEGFFEMLASVQGLNISMRYRTNVPEFKYAMHTRNGSQKKIKNSANASIWDYLFLSAFQYPFAPALLKFSRKL